MTKQETEQLKPFIERLESMRIKIGEIEKRELSESQFAKRFLQFSDSAWASIRSGSYLASFDSTRDKLAAAFEDIESRLPGLADAAEIARQFQSTSLARAVIASIKRAREGVSNRRIVVVLAPTGHGKTTIGEYLRTKGAIVVEGRQAWRNAYRAFCADVARAAGRKLASTMPESRLEEEMLLTLSAKPRTLFIDEANTMSAKCANAIKTIVNRTECCVVIAAIPELWDRFLGGSQQEAAQLINRCQPILRAKGITPADAKLFLHAKFAAIPHALEKVVKAANAFGGIRTVMSISESIENVETLDQASLEAALNIERDNLAAAGLASLAKSEY